MTISFFSFELWIFIVITHTASETENYILRHLRVFFTYLDVLNLFPEYYSTKVTGHPCIGCTKFFGTLKIILIVVWSDFHSSYDTIFRILLNFYMIIRFGYSSYVFYLCCSALRDGLIELNSLCLSFQFLAGTRFFSFANKGGSSHCFTRCLN